MTQALTPSLRMAITRAARVLAYLNPGGGLPYWPCRQPGEKRGTRLPADKGPLRDRPQGIRSLEPQPELLGHIRGKALSRICGQGE
ncbi:hypothetical protein ES705_09513 [subsurface metagenome]